MNPSVVSQLLEINRVFYTDFGGSFAETRRRIQPGVRRILDDFICDGDWLDLGCGSGALGAAWAESGLRGSYIGMDFSESLLAEAAASALTSPTLTIRYRKGDLLNPDWDLPFLGQRWRGVLSFAALHHLPGAENRANVFRKVYALLQPGGQFIYSVWQFQRSEKLMRRVLPWETVGLTQAELEPGDTLLDWRHALPGQAGETGLRYVHLFSVAELEGLARDCDFTVEQQFDSDGKEGNLALYQLARK